ncbi:MAG: hypothetical protein QNJ64_16370 [Crocosphaera sp.]|nr:hypothetical protein [Crocosphaera sp.]
MDGYKVRLIIFCLLVGLYLFLSHPFYFSPAVAGDLVSRYEGNVTGGGQDEEEEEDEDKEQEGGFTVETEIGPEFEEGDAETIEACTLAVFEKKFPFDFIQAPVTEGRKQCPKLVMFEVEHEACFIVETFERIEPGIIASMFILAIMAL